MSSVPWLAGPYVFVVVPMEETLEQPAETGLAICGAQASLRGTLRYVSAGCRCCFSCWILPVPGLYWFNDWYSESQLVPFLEVYSPVYWKWLPVDAWLNSSAGGLQVNEASVIPWVWCTALLSTRPTDARKCRTSFSKTSLHLSNSWTALLLSRLRSSWTSCSNREICSFVLARMALWDSRSLARLRASWAAVKVEAILASGNFCMHC